MPSAAPQQLRPLTTLRFFAAGWVVLYHYWPSLSAAAIPGIVAKGYLGVELFFVLSGFILSHVYLENFGAGRFGYGSFLKTRIARIWPLHIATLAGAGALVGLASLVGLKAGGGFIVWKTLPTQILMVHAWGLGMSGGWNHPSWSISAEWAAYLAFPAFAWAAWRLRDRPARAIVGAGILIGIIYPAFATLAGFPLTRATVAWGALRIMPCFALGCALWLGWRTAPAWSAAKSVAVAAAVLAAIGAAALTGAPDAVSVALFGALIFALAALARSGSPLMSSRLGVYLGEVSYAVYMVCIPWQLGVESLARKVLHLSGPTLPAPVWAGMLVGLIPAAMLAHHLIEVPARLAIRAWRPFPPAPRPATAAREGEAMAA